MDDPRRPHGRRLRVRRDDLVGHAPRTARALLGSLLVRREDDGTDTVVRIVETEAYRETDPASHSHGGVTPRTAVMFERPGHLYVYFTYGMHHCMNIVCEPSGTGAAALVRAAVPVGDDGHLRRRRGADTRARDLMRGPARLTRALGIDTSDDGVDLLVPGGALRLMRDGFRPGRIASGARVGVRLAPDRRWRWWLDGVPEVSRYVRHRQASPG